MQFTTILVLLLVFWLWMRRPEERDTARRDGSNERDRQIDALTRRVSTLEAILLDRDRQLRDRFGEL